MATISISQLDTATQAKVDDLYEVAVVDANSQTGYASRKLTAAQIATLIAQGVQFSGLSTEAKTIIASINEAAQNGGTEVEANPAGESTDTLKKIGIDGTIYEVGGSEPVSKTVTGNPIHIEDAADAPIVSGEITFEPKQDLHGYDKPWAGGAGKNKLSGLVLSRLKDHNTTGTWSGNVYSINGGTITALVDDANNVTGISVNGTFNADTVFSIGRTSDLLENLTNNTEYVLNGISGGSDSTYFIYGYHLNNNTGGISLTSGESSFTWNSATNDANTTFQIKSGYNATNVTIYPMIRLATETDPTFEPYSNICPIEGYTVCEIEVTDDATTPTVTNAYTIDLDGTRYGGTVDLVSGEMKVDRGIVKVDDSWSLHTYGGKNYLNKIVAGIDTSLVKDLICSMCEFGGYGGSSIFEDGKFYQSSNSEGDLYIQDSRYVTKSDFLAAYNDCEIVYYLANPQTVQLTPEQIKTLEGTNNISTNMTSMSLEYITQDYQPLVELIERSAGHHYSTQERVVGTWFGKPLYEKSWNVSIELPSSSANTWVSTGIETASVNCGVIAGGELIDDQNQCIAGSIGFIQQKTYFAIYSQIGGRTITTVTIRYTKTTD